MARLSILALVLGLLAATAPAQRPKTAAEALARFAKVADQAEAERRRAAGDLGDFAEPEVTAVLLAELGRAEELGYRQTVVRALGERLRADPGVVPALQRVLQQAENPRLMDSAAEGLARQGDAGVQALGAVLGEEREGGARRSAVCNGLGRADGDGPRDLLVREVQTASGRHRLPPFEALGRRAGDPVVDDLRVLLARDRDVVIAAVAVGQLAAHRHAEAPALALELSRRLDDRATPDQQTAVLRGLLLRLDPAHHAPLVAAAARARDPFGKTLVADWTAALADEPFRRWLVGRALALEPANERRAAAAALGFVPLPARAEVAPVLVKLLAAKEPDVVRTAALVLAGFGVELAQAPLHKLLQSGPEAVLPAAAQALHELRGDDPAWHRELVACAKGRSASLRAAALQLLAQAPGLDGPTALQTAGEVLADPAWPVRAAAIDLIETLRLPAGIPWLIERLDVEQARLHQDVAETLFALTRLRLADGTAWRAWWQKEGPTFRVPAPGKEENGRRERPQPTAVTYWDIPVRSDRVAFVVDVSGSMAQPFGTGGGTRLDEAKRQLARVLGMLPPKARANVIAFGTGVDGFAATLAPLDDKRRKAAAAWAQALAVRGATNVHAGLQRAFADPEVDTIFLLTDGQPSAGPIVAPEPLAKEVAAWNLGRGIRIHTVALGGKSDFLERLARDSGGEHTVAR